MTTVIWDHGKIIYDSRAVSGDLILSDEINKHLKIKGVHFWTIGVFETAKQMADAYIRNDVSNLRLAKTEDCESDSMLVVLEKDGTLYTLSYDIGEKDRIIEFKEPVIVPQWAWGSGHQLAIGAMTAGVDGYKAMLAVMKKDFHTGGRINIFDTDKKRRINETELYVESGNKA